MHPYLDTLLTQLLDLLLLQEFDPYLFDEASHALYWLTFLRYDTYATWVHQLIENQEMAQLKERLVDSVQELNAAIQQFNASQAKPSRFFIQEFKQSLMRFLVNVRGFLRVK